MENTYGKIIFIHGASSSGKSTIAKQLQRSIDLPFWHISIDHLRDSGVLPLARITTGEFRWNEMRESFFSGFHYSLPAYAHAGNNLIVEHIIETTNWHTRLVELLKPFDLYFVGLQCNVEELERREQARNDRPRGSARKDYEQLQQLNFSYDLEIDATLPVTESAAKVLSAWNHRSGQSKFARMSTRV